MQLKSWYKDEGLSCFLSVVIFVLIAFSYRASGAWLCIAGVWGYRPPQRQRSCAAAVTGIEKGMATTVTIH